MKWYRAFTFLFTSIATGLTAAFLVLLLRPDLAGRDAPPPAPRPILLERSGGPVSYADAVQRAAPSVVNVFASKITRETPHPLFQDPLFKRFFGDQAGRPRYKRENSLGSGVIVEGNGYILTNNHVIEAASEIEVVLSDGRALPARIVGSDPETDIAVLQAAGDKLPAAALGAGGGYHCPDAIIDGTDVQLRAERSGAGDGRVYEITVSAADACGNVGTCTVSVGVPKNQSPGSVPLDSGQDFNAATCPDTTGTSVVK